VSSVSKKRKFADDDAIEACDWILQVEAEKKAMHNLLYFLYTGTVNLNPKDRPGPGYPPCIDAYSLYSLAHMCMVENLKALCLEYLSKTLTVDNIVEKVFECPKHPEVEELYVQFLLMHFNEVKNTDPWEEAVIACNNSIPRRDMLLKLTRYLSYN